MPRPRVEAPIGARALSRANTCGAVGLWDKAIADLDLAALAIRPFNQPWVERAAYQLRNGDVDGYRNSCKRMRQLGVAGDPQRAARFALCWLLRPDAFSDARTPQNLARIAVTGKPADPWCLLALGAAHCRAGKYKPAADQLELALQQLPQPKDNAGAADAEIVIAWLFLAMTQHQLGQAEPAQRWLTMAVQSMDRESNAIGPLRRAGHVWAMCQILRREAEGLLKKAE